MEKRRQLKKALSLLITYALVLGMIPTAALKERGASLRQIVRLTD